MLGLAVFLQPVGEDQSRPVIVRVVDDSLEEGVFVGPSAGANVFAALQVAREGPEPATIVTVLPDGGSKYLSGDLWRAT